MISNLDIILWGLFLTLSATDGLRTLPQVPAEKVVTISGIPMFKAAEHWSDCKANILRISDQGPCKTCASLAAASTISNRICIEALKQGKKLDIQISASQAAACSLKTDPPLTAAQVCTMPSEELAAKKLSRHETSVYRLAALTGIVTGGSYTEKDFCVYYPVRQSQDKALPTDKLEIPCVTACTNKNYNPDKPVTTLDPTEDADELKRRFNRDVRKIDSYWQAFTDIQMDKKVNQDIVLRMKYEIFTNGPITAGINPVEGFAQRTAVWREDTNLQTTAHAVRIIGWDEVTKDGEPAKRPCWIVANSYGDMVHNLAAGKFFVEMGSNVMFIESSLAAPIINLPDPGCKSSTFALQKIDAAVWLDYRDITKGIYLFQGPCAQRVKFSPDFKRLEAVGTAQSIEKTFLTAPTTVSRAYYENGAFSPSFVNKETGEGVNSCQEENGPVPPKFGCQTTKVDAVLAGEISVILFGDNRMPEKYSIFTDFVSNGMLTKAARIVPRAVRLLQGDLDNLKQFAAVDSLLAANGKSTMVFGHNGKNEPVVGILAIDDGGHPNFGIATWSTPPGPARALLQAGFAA